MEIKTNLIDFFNDLEDPRRNKGKKHLLTDLVAITICAVICGADSWDDIEEYGTVEFLLMTPLTAFLAAYALWDLKAASAIGLHL